MLELIALLECYNTYDHNGIYYEVARAILENYNNIDASTVEAFADSIHVSVSTVNRFVKQLYYENFSTYRLFHTRKMDIYKYDGKYYPRLEREPLSFKEYSAQTLKLFERGLESVKEEEISKLVKLMLESREIVFIGIPVHSEIWRIQVELVLLGKKTSAYIDPNYQMDAVEDVNEDSLVISVIYMRQDDNHNQRLLENAQKRGAKTAVISHLPYRLDGPEGSLEISFSGSKTQADALILQSILHYIGSLLRDHLLYL